MFRLAKRLLMSSAALASLSFAQAPSYKQTFVDIPTDHYCQINLTGMPGMNTVTLTGSASGSLIGTLTTDLSDGKAARISTAQFSRAQKPTDVIVQGQARFTADMVCFKEVGKERRNGGHFAPLYSSQSIPAQEFPQQRFTTFSRSPASVFNNAVPEVWTLYDTDRGPSFRTSIVASNQTSAANPSMNFTTAQKDPGLSNAIDHSASRTIPRGTTGVFALDDLLSRAALENSDNGTVRLQGADGGAMPVFGYQRSSSAASTFTIEAPEWRASRKQYIVHVFTPPEGQDTINNWENAIAIQNISSRPSTVYVRPYDRDGRRLDQKGVVLLLQPGQSYVGRTQDLFKNIPGKERTVWAEVTSQEPVQTVELFKYDNHIVAIPAASHLDAGQALRSTRVQANGSAMTSIALLNPGTETETVAATVYGFDGKPIPILGTDGQTRQSALITLGAKKKEAKSILDLLQAKPETFENASYVQFTDITPAISGKEYDFHNSRGRIVGLAIHGSWQDGVLVDGMLLQNMDRIRMDLSKSTFNPKDSVEYDERKSGPARLTTTVISGDRNITSVTYNPLADGDLTKGYGANLTARGTPDRIFFGEGATVNGVRDNELPFTAVEPAEIDYKFKPRVTVNLRDANSTAEKYELRTQLTLLGEHDFAPDAGNPGYSLSVMKTNTRALAELFWQYREAFVIPTPATSVRQLEENFAWQVDERNPNRTAGWNVFDRTSNGFAVVTVTQPPGTFGVARIKETEFGEELVDALKQILYIGHKSVDRPNLK